MKYFVNQSKNEVRIKKGISQVKVSTMLRISHPTLYYRTIMTAILFIMSIIESHGYGSLKIRLKSLTVLMYVNLVDLSVCFADIKTFYQTLHGRPPCNEQNNLVNTAYFLYYIRCYFTAFNLK